MHICGHRRLGATLGHASLLHNPQPLLLPTFYLLTFFINNRLPDPIEKGSQVKFRSERDTLVDALITAGRATTVRSAAAPALSGVHLSVTGNHLRLVGTDQDLTIRTTQEVIGIDDGACVVPARLAADIVRALEAGAVTVELKDETVEISSARAKFSLRTFPVISFPTLSDPPTPSMTLPALSLGEGLHQVVRAASKDDARPLLTGVLLTQQDGAIRLVATDSYRLALRDLIGTAALSTGEDILVPARALSELQRLHSADHGATVGVAPGDTDITFSLGSVSVTTRLLDGTYPDYRQLIPDTYPNRLHVGKESILAALRRVRLLVQDNTNNVKLSLREGGVDLSVTSQEVGEASESVDGDFTGENMVIAFNPTYLIDGIEAVADDEVYLETAEPSRPATIRAASGDDFRYLLMPVRVP